MKQKNPAIPKEEIIDIDVLKIDGHNPNVMGEKQRKALRLSMEKYGFIIPIITNKDYLIADGQHRWEIAKEMGFGKVPVIRLPLKDVDRRILRQVLNKLRGEHDKEADLEEFERILAEIGDPLTIKELLPDDDIAGVLRKLEDKDRVDNLDVERAYEKPKYKVKQGHVWQLGKHRLMCGDSTKEDTVKNLLENTCVHCVFTDPPFNLQWTGGGQEKKGSFKKKWPVYKYDDVTADEYDQFLEKVAHITRRSLLQDGHFYVCIDWRQYPLLLDKLSKELYVDELIVWDKTFIKIGGKYRNQHEFILFGCNGKKLKRWFGPRNESNVWSIITDPAQSYQHPTQRPVDLVVRGVKNSTQDGESVLDLFGGSGSTLIACEKIGRKCYMMELDERYCSVIIERWEAYTGERAKKV